MAQLTSVGQGQLATFGPLLATAMVLVSLVLALLGIKFWGFRRRLTFDRAPASQQPQQQSQSQQTPRYAAYESQVNGTDNAVHGVFRQRNTDEFESIRPTNSAASKYLTGSVPNLTLASLAPREPKEVPTIPELSGTVPYRNGPEPQAAQRRRREVHSANYEYYATPPTRQPPAPPGAADAPAAPPAPLTAAESAVEQLDIPNFDHFAEKYELISAKPAEHGVPRESQLVHKENGRYVKYERVDDVPELLTPDDDQAGASISVAAMVHHIPKDSQQDLQLKSQMTIEEEPQLEPKTIRNIELNNQLLPLEHTDSAFVVEIIAGTPDAIEQTEPVIAPKLFDDLEVTSHHLDAEFELKRSSYEMNEADILDIQPDFSGLQPIEPAPSSPPGFGKSIDEDWENFENLDHVTDLPEPNWSVHPALLESPLEAESETNLELENVVQQETLFQQLELMEPTSEVPQSEPPPYEARLPPPPILPDYESLMQQEKSKTQRNLPRYADVVGQDRANNTKYVSSIEDLFGELQVNGETLTGNSTHVSNFEELCEELEIVPSPVPARRAPQPAPRVSKPTTLNARGDAPPLTCYEPEELPNSSSSEEEAVGPAPQTQPQPQPLPAKRQRHVRFDVENLQYYQSAEVPSSNESEVDFQSADESDTELPPRTTQRMVTLPTDGENNVPRLFGTQVSQEESDDDDGAFGRAIREHRTMTESLRPVVQLDRNSERGAEA
ncbi:uncharacterized protein LOC117787814 [Drosophila innubila]|uniref:uncharacterized protein LOC117787814 n=1 Tax=Drosophila innubila TaxID=198719 RepID=UPI00148E2614|nr:uncharacterized protein LOC117787814 [Drosophila innubila]